MRKNLILLCYAEINPVLENHQIFKGLLGRLPYKEQDRVLSYYQPDDQVRTLLGRLLLIEGSKLFKVEMNLNKIQYSKYCRPYYDDVIDFNISHAGKYVICGISTSLKIGVDIEKNQFIDIHEYRTIFSPIEWNEIIESHCPINEFYRNWVVKEAILKQMGYGLTLTTDVIKYLKIDSQKIHFVEIDKSYTSVVVSSKNNSCVLKKHICFV